MSPSAQSSDIQVVFRGRGDVATEPFTFEASPDEVVARTLCSLMSIGTENIVLNQLYAPDTHWDQWVRFPFHPGYSVIATLTDVPEGTAGLKVGQTVALRCPHSSRHAVKPDICIPVPEGVDPRLAVWFALAKIAFMGVKAGGCALGSRVLVIGAGPIGQMATRWAAAAGAGELTVVDPAAARLDLARRGGASVTLSEPIEEVTDRLKREAGRPEIVIDTTGNAKVFASALAAAADFGKVGVLGDTGFPGQQALTPDVISRGLSVVGAHDGHNTPQWNDRTVSELFFNLIARGRINLEGLNSHEFEPAKAAEAYELANTRRTETMGLIFNWGL
jgi:threonine dehydrogenase-like Zn-dependent dehydrogenase